MCLHEDEPGGELSALCDITQGTFPKPHVDSEALEKQRMDGAPRGESRMGLLENMDEGVWLRLS